MKRVIIGAAAAALSLIGIAALGDSPVKAAACTVEVHVALDVNGSAQGQDLCLPEGLGLPALPA